MNAYDEALSKVLDHLLAMKNCEVVDEVLRQSMLALLRDRFREIANRTTNWSNHAGRTEPCYFDVEATFDRMDIKVSDLKAICQADSEAEDVVECPEPETCDQDFHRGPQPMLCATKPREMACTSHIPDYLPPFPAPHTYRNTVMEQVTKRSYLTARERHAENQLNTQRALNGFYLRCNPKLSLFESNQNNEVGNVLAVLPPKKPSFLDALMPRSQVFETDIYENKEEITHAVLRCRFLKEPKEPREQSSHRPVEHCQAEDVEMQELDSDSDEEDFVSVDEGEAMEESDGLQEINWSQPD
ncbi:transcription initiation factor TFIID subunit 8 [Drosophila biarmipes]|uniref:transcription initiation factor TFIID subunit 8 n=1 Tax=Drosophila biarmipes TaxID=125945 RepID=UPI0007E76B92|nr:transcription initiation factor TFIID subunit 8 [Drosophila biarmipes]